MTGEPDLDRVLAAFRRVFPEETVRLQGGFAEPFYAAASVQGGPEIRFTRDYVNSCLHEVAHWCIAGKARRLRDDYGYWYNPDGRNAEAQEEFFRFESGPQALEWAFALACGACFRMSCDNLGGEVRGESEFAAALAVKMEKYLRAGFPPRGRKFLEALLGEFHPGVASENLPLWLQGRLGNLQVTDGS